jgi:hypothetical protein
MERCSRTDCDAAAVSVLGIACYPPEAVMRAHQSTKPLTRIILGLHVCDRHLKEAQECGPANLISARDLELFTGLIERSTGVAVDRTATVVVRVDFTDPDYQTLCRVRARPS